jgi:hypothetical protein
MTEPRRLAQRIVTHLTATGWRVEFNVCPFPEWTMRREVKRLDETPQGVTDFRTHVITIRPGLDAEEYVRTLAHEWVHTLLHRPEQQDTKVVPVSPDLPRKLRLVQVLEAEAEMTATAFLDHHGIWNKRGLEYLNNYRISEAQFYQILPLAKATGNDMARLIEREAN